MNVSELVRQAVQGFNPAGDERDMVALIRQVNISTNEANNALDEALSFVAESNKRIEAMSKAVC